MKIQSRINNALPVFEIHEPLEQVIEFFTQSTFSHVAITNEGKYLGVLAEKDLSTFETGKKIDDYRYNLEVFAASEEATWMDVLEIFTRKEANLLPVLNQGGEVLGYYELNNIITMIIDIPFFAEPGSLLVVAKGIADYSFSEIAQIVESNNAKLFGAFVTATRNDIVQITLKLSSGSLNEVIQTFRRYNYNILYGNKDDQFLEDLKQRSDYLDKYLNV